MFVTLFDVFYICLEIDYGPSLFEGGEIISDGSGSCHVSSISSIVWPVIFVISESAGFKKFHFSGIF